MAGKKVTKLRELLADAEIRLAESVGTADEAFARNRVQAITDELDAAVAYRAERGKKPGETDAPRVAVRGPRTKAVRAKREERRVVAGIVNMKPQRASCAMPSLDVEAGVLAAELAVEGVCPSFALLKRGEPEPLSEDEFANARDIVVSVEEDSVPVRLLSDSSMSHDRWLAEAFPSLTEARRVKCARFLSGMATLAAEKPGEDSRNGSSVIERALAMSGMTYVELENARAADSRFEAAQTAIRAARKRCIMDRLEETLQNRALFGQREEVVDRFGQRHESMKIDNRLAFDMLKHGHDQYLKQNIKDKAEGSGMTLMIAQGAYPESPVARQPKQAEVIDVK